MAKPAARKPSAPARPDRSGIWIATALVALLIATVVVYKVSQQRSAPAPKPSAPSAVDRSASAKLRAAAAAVGFHTSTEPGVGLVESEPASAAPSPASSHLLAVGAQAPSFTLKTPQGQPFTFPVPRKVTLIEFFATWCPHCQAEAPHLHKLADSMDPAKVAFVSVNADSETAPSVFAFHSYFGLPYPALVDINGTTGSFDTVPGSIGKAAAAYGMQYYPTFFIAAPDGRIAWRSDGEQPDVLLRQELLKAAG
jgi:thiol-disulfide isomerase/thioredoxin